MTVGLAGTMKTVSANLLRKPFLQTTIRISVVWPSQRPWGGLSSLKTWQWRMRAARSQVPLRPLQLPQPLSQRLPLANLKPVKKLTCAVSRSQQPGVNRSYRLCRSPKSHSARSPLLPLWPTTLLLPHLPSHRLPPLHHLLWQMLLKRSAKQQLRLRQS